MTKAEPADGGQHTVEVGVRAGAIAEMHVDPENIKKGRTGERRRLWRRIQAGAQAGGRENARAGGDQPSARSCGYWGHGGVTSFLAQAPESRRPGQDYQAAVTV